MGIQKIIQELIYNNVIPSEPTEYKQLKGGTVSEVYLLNMDGMKYVVKLNDRQVIESEVIFLDHYKRMFKKSNKNDTANFCVDVFF